MKIQCPSAECLAVAQCPKNERVIRRGYFYRSSDRQRIHRFQCRHCRKTFSSARLHPNFLQKKRLLNRPIEELLISGVSQRRVARLLKISRSTVSEKLKFLAARARARQEKYRERWKENPLTDIQFDDLETSEHSKCKPLSVALAVDSQTRKILGFQVSQMPARGLLARKSIEKYGYRKDERSVGWHALFESLKPLVNPRAKIHSDQNPHYPRHLRAHFKDADHCAYFGGRGCIAGQGELKKLHFDPLFSLNHTCAMLRANLNRLFRRTWCTTKKREGLIDHLALYVDFHNRVLTE
ncbi:MAG: transposase [Proteobacteria bacterium]|nr:MAG: transposase [Pseudomonadota bacterium]